MKKIIAVGVDEIVNKIYTLCYANQGALSFYWDICQRGSVNARRYIDFFPISSRRFKTEKKLWKSSPNYRVNRWKWIRRILKKLEDGGYILVKPINNSPTLGVQPERKFKRADYLCSPLISELTLKFGEGRKTLTLRRNVVEIHKWIRHFNPGRARSKKKKLKNKVSGYKRFDVVRIIFFNQ